MREKLIQQVDEIISDELDAAKKKFPANNSRHESYAVLREEFEEMQDEERKLSNELDNIWDATKKNTDPDILLKYLHRAQNISRKLAAEAVQTAAMIDKFLEYENGIVAPVQPEGVAEPVKHQWNEDQKQNIQAIKEAYAAARAVRKKKNVQKPEKSEQKPEKSEQKAGKKHDKRKKDIDDSLIVYMKDVQNITFTAIAKQMGCCAQTVINRYNAEKLKQ